MWILVFFVLVGTEPVAIKHPMDFHTEEECFTRSMEELEALNHQDILWANSFCVLDPNSGLDH